MRSLVQSDRFPPPLPMDKTPQHRQTVGERAASSHLRRVVTKMSRTERLAIAVVLATHCFNEVNRLHHSSVEISDFVVEGGPTFNENLRDIKTALLQLPTKDLAEMLCSIMLPELTTSMPQPTNHS